MSTDPLLSGPQLAALCAGLRLDPLQAAAAVIVTSITPGPYAEETGRALLAAVAANTASPNRLPYLVAAHPDLGEELADKLAEAGAYVFPIESASGAPATAYRGLTQLVTKYCDRSATMIMVGPGQNIAAQPQNITMLCNAATRRDVVIGRRGYDTLLTHSGPHRLVASIMMGPIADIAGAPYDVNSGIAALSRAGRDVLLGTNHPGSDFMLDVAYWARRWMKRTGAVEVTFEVAGGLADAEQADSTYLATLSRHAKAQLAHAVELVAQSPSDLSERQRLAYTGALIALDVLCKDD